MFAQNLNSRCGQLLSRQLVGQDGIFRAKPFRRLWGLNIRGHDHECCAAGHQRHGTAFLFRFLSRSATMSRTMLALASAMLISLPGAAMAEVYPSIPAPLPGATPQRLSPRQVFYWLDTNHDGFLSLNEFLAAPWVKNKQRAARFFRWMDTNKDGRVSLQEFLAACTRYCGDSGYWVRTAYPWAWSCWRPWRYGWYWQSGWHRRPGAWRGIPRSPASPRRWPASCPYTRRARQASSSGQAAQGHASWQTQGSRPCPCPISCQAPLNARQPFQADFCKPHTVQARAPCTQSRPDEFLG